MSKLILIFVLAFGAICAAGPLEKANIGSIYDFEIVADNDKASQSDDKKNTYESDIRIGTVKVVSENKLDIVFDKQSFDLVTRYAYKGRGAELSELINVDGKMLTFDDRSGIISDITKRELVPWAILGDGAGNETKGFKCEWATIKDGFIYVGSVGRENYDDDTDDFKNNNHFFVKKVSKTGQVTHENWIDRYNRIRNALGMPAPGFISHEAVMWSDVHKKWIMLPRKCSKESFIETDVDGTGCNKMIIANEDFTTIEHFDIQATPLQKERGFSSFKFVPDTQDSMIVGLTTVEKGKTINTAIIGLDLQGRILFPETKVFDAKYEGLAFYKHVAPKNSQ